MGHSARLGAVWGHLARVAPVAVVLVFVEVAVYLFLFVQSMDFVGVADSTADWLAASAARDGLDPYADLRAIAMRYGSPYRSPAVALVGDAPWIHPRLAGGLLALQPLTLLSPEHVFALIAISSFALLAWVGVRYSPRASGWSWMTGLGLASLFAFSAPFLRTMQFGSWGMLFAAVIWWFWSRLRRGEAVMAGAAVGVLAAFKLYPLVMLVPAILARRWRTAGTLTMTFLLSNLMGALVFDIGVSETIDALGGAGDVWLHLPSNGSLVPWVATLLHVSPVGAAMVVSSLGAFAIWVAWRATLDIDLVVALTVLVMLLASPLSWMSNDVIMLLPVAIAAGRVDSWVGRLPLVVWTLLVLLPAYDIPNSGTASLGGRLLILGLLFALVSRGSARLGLVRFGGAGDAGPDAVPSPALQVAQHS